MDLTDDTNHFHWLAPLFARKHYEESGMNQSQRRVLVWSFLTLSACCVVWLVYLRFFYSARFSSLDFADLLHGNYPGFHWPLLLGIAALILGLYTKAGE